MGSKLLYYIILLPFSRLPFWMLYGFSDFLYIVLYRLIGYRTKVVRQNLINTFTEKSEKDIKEIEAKFYRHLCDIMVESVKAFTISTKETKKRMIHRNVDVVNQFKELKKNVVLVGGHYGNWELYAIGVGMVLSHHPIALYTPLKNQFINDKITESRSKYGLQMLSIQSIKNKLEAFNDDLYAVIFAADQSPRKSQKAYWMSFLNQETGVQFGTEKFAKAFEAAVVFGNIYKVKRGYYEVEYEVICENAHETEYGFITEQHTKMLEKAILNQPEYWLWSHRRWKHKRPENVAIH